MKKEIKIKVPEGYEIDKENSTFECIKFKPIEVTLDRIIENADYTTIYCPKDNNQYIRRMRALNTIFLVADYLNGDWKCIIGEPAYSIYYSKLTSNFQVYYTYNHFVPKFKTRGLAENAIEILGEKVLEDAFFSI